MPSARHGRLAAGRRLSWATGPRRGGGPLNGPASLVDFDKSVGPVGGAADFTMSTGPSRRLRFAALKQKFVAQ